MTFQLPPSGTRGFTMPKLAAPLARVGMKVSHFLYRLLGERMRIQGQPLLMLTTVGARTGQPRRSLLGRFEDPDRPGSFWVVGSNAGAARHPGWCYNLAKSPDQAWVEMAGRKSRVVAVPLQGQERDRAWERVVSLAPAYRRYETVTDRQVPIIRLSPRA